MTTEHSIAIVSFKGALKREIARVLKKLKQDESVSWFDLEIEASGRPDGDIKIEYKLYDDQAQTFINGQDLDAMTDESHETPALRNIETAKRKPTARIIVTESARLIRWSLIGPRCGRTRHTWSRAVCSGTSAPVAPKRSAPAPKIVVSRLPARELSARSIRSRIC